MLGGGGQLPLSPRKNRPGFLLLGFNAWKVKLIQLNLDQGNDGLTFERSSIIMVLFLVQILQDLGVRTMRLMTNNPSKFIGLKGYGLSVVGRVPLLTPITSENRRYLEAKRAKMGHVYGPQFNRRLRGSDEVNGPT